MLDSSGLRFIDVASRAGTTMTTVSKIDHGDIKMQLESLLRIAVALGCAPVELMPSLARRPRKGLLHERGYYASHQKGQMVRVSDREDFEG